MMLDDALRSIAAEAPSSTARELDRLGEGGLLAAPLPVAAGGGGIGAPGEYLRLLHLLREIGANDLPAGRIYEGHVNALALVDQYARGDQRTSWEQDARRARWFGVWNTDGALPVTMERHGDAITLHGAKLFCSGAGRVERALITATVEGGGRYMVVVPMEDLAAERIDVGSWKPLGMQDSDSFAIDFEGVVLPAGLILGGANDYLTEPWFNGGAIRFAAVQLGGAERLAREAAAYIAERGRGGDPFQQQRAAESAIALETGRLWLAGAAEHYDRALRERIAEHDELLMRYARMTRTAIETGAQRVLRDVERSVGAFGFLEPLPFARLHRDLTMYLRQPAPDATLLSIGRHALGL